MLYYPLNREFKFSNFLYGDFSSLSFAFLKIVMSWVSLRIGEERSLIQDNQAGSSECTKDNKLMLVENLCLTYNIEIGSDMYMLYSKLPK